MRNFLCCLVLFFLVGTTNAQSISLTGLEPPDKVVYSNTVYKELTINWSVFPYQRPSTYIEFQVSDAYCLMWQWNYATDMSLCAPGTMGSYHQVILTQGWTKDASDTSKIANWRCRPVMYWIDNNDNVQITYGDWVYFDVVNP